MIHLDTMTLIEGNSYWYQRGDPNYINKFTVFFNTDDEDSSGFWFEDYHTSYCYPFSELNECLPVFDTLQEYANYYFPENKD